MKQRLIMLAIFLIVPIISLKAQKFSTQSGYEKYFKENFKQLDKIEGIWKEISRGSMASNNKPVGQSTTSTVAIIFEGLDYLGNKVFGKYYFENGNYDPTRGKGKIIKYKDYGSKYVFRDSDPAKSGISMSSDPFWYAEGEDITYKIVLSQGGTSSLIIELTLYKAFPFEGDINK